MNPAVTGRDGHALAARYEQLRQDVVASTGHHGGGGLALLMRKGMAAWMNSVENEPPHRTAVPASSCVASRPEGIERGLIDIVAAMALAAVSEFRHDI